MVQKNAKTPAKKKSTKPKSTKPKNTKAKTEPKTEAKTASRKVAAQLRSTEAKMEPVGMRYLPWNSIPIEEVNPLFGRQFVHGQKIMMARVLLKKTCVVPEHSHHNEQISYVLEGALRFWIDGRVLVVKAGDVLVIPSDMPHKAEALEDSVGVDVFTPPRADWINKTDRYLR